MSTAAIELNEVSLRFNGHVALDQVSSRAEAGEVIGLIGRNGAGKTTLLETLVSLLPPDTGKVRLLGCDSRNLSDETRQQLGFVFQEDELFSWMRVTDHLDLVAAHYRDWDQNHADRLLQRWRIPCDRKISALSRGQRQMLAIVLAISHRPRVLLLDEPASALDPVARRDFLTELIDLACDENRTVVLSSHLISDVERIASRIWLLRDGKLIIDEPLDALKEGLVSIEVRGNGEIRLPEIPGTVSHHRDALGQAIIARNPPENLLDELRQQVGDRLRLRHLNLEQIALEFLQ